jgi:benzodiazapine receptor
MLGRIGAFQCNESSALPRRASTFCEDGNWLRIFTAHCVAGTGGLMRWVSLLGWIVVCFAVAGISGSWTAREVAGWYLTLNRPSIAPPNWVFAPVWSLLYLLMAIAAWQVWESGHSPARNLGIALFLVQLGLNFAWSWIFFRQHAIGVALAEIVVLWVAIAATGLAFTRVSLPAAGLMTPYLVWVSFATLLNYGFWRLN